MAKTSKKSQSVSQSPASPVTLVIPCRAEYVALSRLVVGALGAREGLDGEAIADLKVVVTEACNCFLAAPGGCVRVVPEKDEAGGQASEESSALHLDFLPKADSWEITVSNPDGGRRIVPGGACDPMTEGGLALTIICALVDSVEQTDSDAEGSALRLVKRVVPEPSPAD